MRVAFLVCGFPLPEPVSGGAHAVGAARSVGLEILCEMRWIAVVVACSDCLGMSEWGIDV